MEQRLVMNNKTNNSITNHELKGQLHQQLKYYKFRRVPSKMKKDIIYLFFRREEETYFALRAAKTLSHISLVRYRSKILVPYDPPFRPSSPQALVDLVRFGLQKHVETFSSVV